MPLYDWFNINIKNHHHIWGPWVLVDTKNLKYNHRVIQGQQWTMKRECSTCGEIDYQSKETKLKLTS